MGMNWKQMIPMMVAMMVVGLTVQLIMTGKIGALLQVFVILAVIALAVLLAYAFEVLPKRMMILMDRITGRTERLKTSRKSKLEMTLRDPGSVEQVRRRARDLVHGQAELVDVVFDALEVKLADKSRSGVLLSAFIGGPKASGKGRFAAVTALTLFGDHRDAIVIDLSKIPAEAAIGEVLSDEGAVWNALSRDNEIVVVIDHAEILLGQMTRPQMHALTDLLEHGRIAGQAIASNSVILMLSDLGHAELGDMDAAKLSVEERQKRMRMIAEQKLPSLNLAIFDVVTATKPLETMDKARIIARHLTEIAAGFDLEVQRVEPVVLAKFVALWGELAGSGSDEILRSIKRQCNVAFASASKRQLKNVRIGWDNATEEIICQ